MIEMYYWATTMNNNFNFRNYSVQLSTVCLLKPSRIDAFVLTIKRKVVADGFNFHLSFVQARLAQIYEIANVMQVINLVLNGLNTYSWNISLILVAFKYLYSS